MMNTGKIMLLLAIGIAVSCTLNGQTVPQKKYIVNGYVAGFRGKVDTDAIKAEKLTHINYAFVDVRDSSAVLTNLETDSINFRKLNELKKVNPDLKIMISIGGWTWSGKFSDAVLTASSRKLFAQTSVDIVRQYQLDGVDIDWEYPAMAGYEGNVFRPEDKRNYTLMFQELRVELDKLEKETGKQYQLTTAVGGSKSYVDNTEMGNVAKIVDYIYVMTYDYSGDNGRIEHHTNLYNRTDAAGALSADQSIRDFMDAGVSADKLVLGIAFYGKAWVAKEAENNGLGQSSMHTEQNQGLAKDQGGGFTKIKEQMIGKNGYQSFWDDPAKAPYLFNSETRVFVTYDDERSVKEKVKYVKDNGLAGVFFWEYLEDPKEYLLKVIDKNINE